MNSERLSRIARQFGRTQRQALLLLSDYCFEAGIGIKQWELDDVFEGDLQFWTDAMESRVSKAAIQLYVAEARLSYYDGDASRDSITKWTSDAAHALNGLEDEARDAA